MNILLVIAVIALASLVLVAIFKKDPKLEQELGKVDDAIGSEASKLAAEAKDKIEKKLMPPPIK
jgi:hypothetical protein